MTNVTIAYNPYKVTTDIKINGEAITKESPLYYAADRRLQEWIEPRGGSWKGIFGMLRENIGESDIEVDFIGTTADFRDMEYANKTFGSKEFSSVKLVHKNMEKSKDADPYQKLQDLKKLYEELQDGPVEEFKSEDIRKNFEAAMNSDFKITVVAPMSSGKSTLINSILCRDMLPAVNQATTAVITEIKDDDKLDDFYVSAQDKYGNVVAENRIATKEVITELNYMKDPNDPEKKDALINKMFIEGPIPHLKSDVMSTVFVDTPGGNNAQNDEHEQMMDDAINDENKSMILYVFNGTQLSTNDSNIILGKIANAMKNSSNGKQSRDRFLFVANRMDDFDTSDEPYEEVIENTILPMLERNGIVSPNLFLVSAQTAKLIRMEEGGDELTESEEDDIDKLVRRFNRCQSRCLPRYGSLNAEAKEKFIHDAEFAAAKAKDESLPSKDVNKYKYKAAELNSGVPALEYAIGEYLEKYAVCIKIKTVHDTFMKKVEERNMINKCEEEWANSKESFENVKKELAEKRKKCDNSKQMQKFKAKVDNIKLDLSPIEEIQMDVVKKLNQLRLSAKAEIPKEEAEYQLSSFVSRVETLGENAQLRLKSALDNGVIKTCDEIIKEYSEYIKQLDNEDFFKIGNMDMKKTANFSGFELKKADDLLNDSKYNETKGIQVGTKRVKQSGVGGFFKRLFTFGNYGYEDVAVYEDKEFIKLQELITEQIDPIRKNFIKETDKAMDDTKKQVDFLKNLTMDKLKDLDKMVSDLMHQIDEMLKSQEELEKRVAENAVKAEWVKEFVNKVGALLDIGG
ncbi:MAG: dynamin family protein [Lachnospiraceae bacterium]|nr:dynamin family protein [Ruminococcus sp.]MCM1274658.1 dynamin family protein [Lachnospiraceae bacterium]